MTREPADLGERLRQLVPDPPAASDRAARAKEYAGVRRRRRLVGVVGATVIAVAGTIAVPAALDRARPAPDPVGDVDPFAVASCPAPLAELPPASTPLPGPDTIPPGAVAVRLCAAVEGAPGGVPPRDALVSGVDDVAAAINARRPAPPPAGCPADGGPTWDLVFVWSDGTTQTARAASHGCGGVRVGSVLRGGSSSADRIVARFERLLWEQRLERPEPAVRFAPPGCRTEPLPGTPGPALLDRRRPVRMVAATLCAPGAEVTIPADDLATLLADYDENLRWGSEGRCANATRELPWWIAGVNPWGDEHTVACIEVEPGDGCCVRSWQPTEESLGIVSRLLRNDG